MAGGRWTGMICGLLLVCSAAVVLADESASLAASASKPPVDRETELKPDEADKTEKIPDVKSLKRYIYEEEKQVEKTEMSKEEADTESGTALAIGDTLKELESEHAVQEEMEMETAIDCEVGEWGKFGKCDKPCDGGTMERTRTVVRHPRNGGSRCPDLNNQVECNTDSCASEEYQREATRRKLTQKEKAREMMANKQKINNAMRSTNTYDMMKRTREVMRKIVHTQTAVVHLPGEEEEQTPEMQVRKSLQEAMAKNAVDAAMQKFDASKVEPMQTEHEQDQDAFKKSTESPIGNGPVQEPVNRDMRGRPIS